MQLFKKLLERREQKKKVQAAYAKGEAFGNYLASKVQAFAESRLDLITVNLLEVFKGRLETVYDDPEHDPKLIASAELEIFKEQIEKTNKSMWAELQEHLSNDLELVGEAGLADALADLIESAVEPRINILIAGAKTLYEGKLKEVDEKTKT